MSSLYFNVDYMLHCMYVTLEYKSNQIKSNQIKSYHLHTKRITLTLKIHPGNIFKKKNNNEIMVSVRAVV